MRAIHSMSTRFLVSHQPVAGLNALVLAIIVVVNIVLELAPSVTGKGDSLADYSAVRSASCCP